MFTLTITTAGIVATMISADGQLAFIEGIIKV